MQTMENDPDLDDMPTNVDFSDAAKPVVGKYAERLRGDVRLVRLDPDVARRFPTSEAVNAALLQLIGPGPDTPVGG